MWTLDGVRIFVQELSDGSNQTIPRLQPVGGGTILQIFGYETSIYKLKGKLVGYSDLETIKGFATDGTTHQLLETPSETVSGYFNKNLYVKSVNAPREKTMMQTIRPDLSCYEPVFSLELELYEE